MKGVWNTDIVLLWFVFLLLVVFSVVTWGFFSNYWLVFFLQYLAYAYSSLQSNVYLVFCLGLVCWI